MKNPVHIQISHLVAIQAITQNKCFEEALFSAYVCAHFILCKKVHMFSIFVCVILIIHFCQLNLKICFFYCSKLEN